MSIEFLQSWYHNITKQANHLIFSRLIFNNIAIPSPYYIYFLPLAFSWSSFIWWTVKQKEGIKRTYMDTVMLWSYSQIPLQMESYMHRCHKLIISGILDRHGLSLTSPRQWWHQLGGEVNFHSRIALELNQDCSRCQNSPYDIVL